MMLISKKVDYVKINLIYVDGWKEEYLENYENGKIELKEKYLGKIPIEEVKK